MLKIKNISLADKIVTYEKIIIICLLSLVVIFINCYYYHTKHWLKNEKYMSSY